MTDEPRRATIHQVARLAGVSHQTVSRYLRHDAGMKPDTRQRVDAAVKALDYRPNLVARSMRTRRTDRLAVVLPSPHWFPVRLMIAASATAHAAGYQLDVVSAEGSTEERIAELADSGQVDGILSLAPVDSPPDTRIPILVSGTYDQEMHGAGELADGSAVSEIVEHLAGLGHRTFFHLAGPPNYTSARNRKLVYLETIARLGLRSYGVADTNWSAQAGYDAIAALPADSGVTAIIAANDGLAMGAIRATTDRGLRVPEDVSVFGWDDEELGRFATPALSTVAVDREAQGREAILHLIATIRGEPAPAKSPRDLNQLVFRESTAPPPD
ncbi:LacI family transcriptional regulator [Kribbella amoyensis]|uniref:LacI family transcriptional regulator n=1 Tax=Kribbella amoyensis TaxID=996641 RepID=A0A561BSG0_9ACTN|nr:LacI family DNA-binding transcriptional regulator [Kribbella amoyensis]TWD81713.1 LacI family transcriptional regulator [Kribbella amoyensis]